MTYVKGCVRTQLKNEPFVCVHSPLFVAFV